MWQEARKQEKHIKTLMVDYKRRAERRRDYYERIKQDPIKFLRVFGRPSKLHLDSEVTKAAENPNNMMPWVGDPSIMIDRFDVRASLEHYDTRAVEDVKLSSTERIEARLCNYERYRCLIHNEYASVTESMALKQIEMDEKYGDLEKRRKEEEEAATKKSQESKAAIGFVYEDSTGPSENSVTHGTPTPQDDSETDDEADSDMDIDVELDVSALTVEARRQLAKSAATFGLHPTDFVRLLDADQQLETELRLAKALEEEKLQLSGRKSRRSRRLLRERRAQEKFPQLLTTKIGLLNGQPISRRTVYLSASSSDSGEYPSDMEEHDFSGIVYGSPTSKAATIRAQRARAKPILSNARGPSVLIGGMTSISLCRRNNKQSGPGSGSKYRSVSSRTSSSSERRSSSGGSPRGRRLSSSSSDRSFSYRGSRSRVRRLKHSRVEYITTFGDNEDEVGNKGKNGGNVRSGPNKQTPLFDQGRGVFGANDSKPPGSAASAVAASVVSKLLSSTKTLVNQGKIGSDSMSNQSSVKKEPLLRSSPGFSDRRRRPPSKSRYRSPSRSRSSSRRSVSSSHGSGIRRRNNSQTRNSSNNRGYQGSYRRYRRSPCQYRSRRRSSSSSKISHSDSSTLVDNGKSTCNRTNVNHPSNKNYGQSSAHLPDTILRSTEKQSSPPVRKRYYRPELESADELELSEEEIDKSKRESSKSSEVNSGRQSISRKLDSHPYGDSAGKMMTSQQLVTGGPILSHDLKSSAATGSGVRIMPQELLKRRVQSQLTKAFNADKKAEMEKQIQLERERQAREEGLRRQARLLRRQEEKRLRAERRAMALELGSNLGNTSDSSSVSSTSSGSRHRSSRVRSRRSPVRRQSSAYSSHHSGGRGYSPPSLSRSRPRAELEEGLLGTPNCTTDGRLPSPPSSSNMRRSFYSSSGDKHDTQRGLSGTFPRDRTERPTSSLLGSPVRSSYYSSKDRIGVSSPSRSGGSREEKPYGSGRSSLPSRDGVKRNTEQHFVSTDNSNRLNQSSNRR
ncbi:unnamed protein product [Heterobilharzia americana]|nr:unnamed protein product [Heterobilharzia americana]